MNDFHFLGVVFADLVVMRFVMAEVWLLKKLDLSSIKTGFVVTLTGQKTSVNVYLDSIRFVR